MTDIQRAELTKELIRAQDALHNAFRAACRADDLDLAAHLRKERQLLADNITRINGGPVKVRIDELFAR